MNPSDVYIYIISNYAYLTNMVLNTLNPSIEMTKSPFSLKNSLAYP